MHRLGRRAFVAGLLATCAALGLITQAGPAPVAAQKTNCRTFPETRMTVCGRFLQYWTDHGGLAQQGYPISPEFSETSDVNGRPYTVQYFERAVFELHPENPAPSDVLLSLLGVSRYKQKYPVGAPGQAPNTSPGSVLFPPTSKRLGGRFLQYWNTHGGLAQQGYPISDEFSERSDLDGKTYRVQYFERAVFESHPENPAPNDVLLSQLGNFQFKLKYPTGEVPVGGPTPPPAPTSAPVPTAVAGSGQPLKFKGTGEMKTQPFVLAGGNYMSEWTATDPTSSPPVGCFHSGFLESVDPAQVVSLDLGSKIVFPGRSAQGTTQLPGITAGQYVLDMTSGCAWTVTISPQR
ncbi:MAG: hypothetical protein ACJ78Q_11915 [Chloroflexia bacterium]